MLFSIYLRDRRSQVSLALVMVFSILSIYVMISMTQTSAEELTAENYLDRGVKISKFNMDFELVEHHSYVSGVEETYRAFNNNQKGDEIKNFTYIAIGFDGMSLDYLRPYHFEDRVVEELRHNYTYTYWNETLKNGTVIQMVNTTDEPHYEEVVKKVKAYDEIEEVGEFQFSGLEGYLETSGIATEITNAGGSIDLDKLDSSVLPKEKVVLFKVYGGYNKWQYIEFKASRTNVWNQPASYWFVAIDSASAWYNNPGWKYRKPIFVNQTSEDVLLNYQIKININTTELYQQGKLNNTCKDVRFTGYSGNDSIDYWIESCDTSGGNSTIWVEVPSIPTTNTTIYMYYGKLNEGSSESNGTKTFFFFDDFSGALTDKWEGDIGAWVISGGELVPPSYDNNVSFIYADDANSNWTYGAVDLSITSIDADAGQFYMHLFGLQSQTNDYKQSARYVFEAEANHSWLYNYTGSFYETMENTSWYDGVYKNYTIVTFHNSTNTYRMVYINSVLEDHAVGYEGYQTDKWLKFGAQYARNPWHIDNIKIRNYTYPEPTYEILPEETEGPEVQITYPSNGTTFDYNFDVHVTITGNSTPIDWAKYRWENDTHNGSYQDLSPGSPSTNFTATLDISELAFGMYKLRVLANQTDGGTNDDEFVYFTIEIYDLDTVDMKCVHYLGQEGVQVEIYATHDGSPVNLSEIRAIFNLTVPGEEPVTEKTLENGSFSRIGNGIHVAEINISDSEFVVGNHKLSIYGDFGDFSTTNYAHFNITYPDLYSLMIELGMFPNDLVLSG